MKIHPFLLLLFVLPIAAVSMAIASERSSRPNFLFVYTDDQRYDQFGAVQREQGDQGRFPWFTTPHMDRLAKDGVRFRNAFVASSLCSPSRVAFLTGRYNHCNGVASNARPLPLDAMTHASLLRNAGYTTAYIGKWHMDNQRERPGFDFHAGFVGQGRFVDCPFLVQGEETPTQGWVDDVSTDYAIDFMEKRKGTNKPWSMVVGFKSPHGPCTPPERAKERFKGEKARIAPNMNVQAIYLKKLGYPPRPPIESKEGLVWTNLDSFRCVSACDDNLGRLLDALDRFGFTENTVVIYTSDNGYYMGEHGLGDKRSAYDESLRIPFVVRFPKLGNSAKGKVVDEPILNIDLAPTLLDYAGVPIPKEMQGRSWRPLLEGEKPDDWRTSWFYEYFAERLRGSKVVDVTAVRTLDAKLIKYAVKDKRHDDWTELFDLKNDPYELNNLYDNPAHETLQRKTEAEYERLKTEVGYRIPDYVDRPAWWDTGIPIDEDTVIRIENPECRLDLSLQDIDAENKKIERIQDTSGYGNDGIAHGIKTGKGKNGEPVLVFDGKAKIELKKTASLNVERTPWTTRIVFKPGSPEGVLLSLGGKSQGYSLRLEEGKLVFIVTINDRTHQVTTKNRVADWCTATAIISADKKMLLYIDDRKVAEHKLPSLVPKDPNFGFRIGMTSDGEAKDIGFSGVISSIRFFAGEVHPK